MKGQQVMPYYLRPMEWEDLDQVEEIEREAFPTLTPSTSYRRELKNRRTEYVVCIRRGEWTPLPTDPPRRVILNRLLRRFGIDLGEPQPPTVRGLMVGFVGLWLIAGEAHIVAIAVREAYRGQGVGELLLQATLEIAAQRQQQTVTLEVRVSNTPAQSLYQKYGFWEVGIRKGYYSDNREDAFIMSTGDLSSEDHQRQFADLRSRFDQRYGTAGRSYA